MEPEKAKESVSDEIKKKIIDMHVKGKGYKTSCKYDSEV